MAKQTSQPSLRDIIGVTERSHEQWIEDCSDALAKLREVTGVIMQRELREGANAMCQGVSAIIDNCRRDPDDIREEIALPAILRNACTVLESYVEILTGPDSVPDLNMQRSAALEMVRDATPKLEGLLNRMRNNDNTDFVERARVVSSVFRRLRGADKPADGAA